MRTLLAEGPRRRGNRMDDKTSRDGVGKTDALTFGDLLLQFRHSLSSLGYTRGSIAVYLGYCRRLCASLERRGVEPSGFCESELDGFAREYVAGCQGKAEPVAAARRVFAPGRLFLAYIRQVGACPVAPAPQRDEAPLLSDYLDFMARHRGVTAGTVNRHRRYLLRFLALARVNSPEALSCLNVRTVEEFVIDAAHTMARQSMGGVCSALRGFLGFAHMRGAIASNLKLQLNTPRLYELETVRRALDWPQVELILKSVDQSTLRGLRDFAILALLAMCGLRAGEVVRLRIEDIDWRHDAINVYRSKTDAADRIPLVSAVGEALIAYLQHRPTAVARQELFVSLRAPYGPLKSSTLVGIVSRAMTAAGVEAPHRGPHTLRHSFAVHLLRQGMSLKTIGDALGHRHPRSTCVYAKASIEDLREVALSVAEVLP